MEDPARGVTGLRGPQIGAVHAVHAHWTVSDVPATIVMPTGTGKTETMLSVLVSARCSRVLVVVPTDALRTQIAEKFLTLGVLKEPGFGVLTEPAKCPIVGLLQHIPRDVAEVDEVFGRCQAIVTTSSIAGQCTGEVRDRMAALCTHLFIDEAHHAEAPTWSAFKAGFRERRVLQFTATPFREDGAAPRREVIFGLPLARRSRRGISGRSVPPRGRIQPETFGRGDRKTAIEPASTGWRCSTRGISSWPVRGVARAKEIFKI